MFNNEKGIVEEGAHEPIPRSLHSSKGLSKPPASAAAAWEDDSGDRVAHTSSSTSSFSKNGSSTAGFGSPTFGSKPAFAATAPTFGSKPAFAAAAPNFGSKPLFGAGTGSFGSKPTFGSSSSLGEQISRPANNSGVDFTLTPQERKARELIMQKHAAKEEILKKKQASLEESRTPVNGFPGRPQDQRNGRYDSGARFTSPAFNGSSRQTRTDYERRSEHQPGLSNRPYYISNISANGSNTQFRANSEREPQTPSDHRTYNQSENWVHLQRRQQELSPTHERPPVRKEPIQSEFLKARAERELQASSPNFVPLANNPIFRSKQTRNDMHAQSPWSRTTNGQTEAPQSAYTEPRSSRPGFYGNSTPLEQRGYKANAPYVPSGKGADPIKPGAWRDEAPPRDDRLRRINKAGSDFYQNVMNDEAEVKSRFQPGVEVKNDPLDAKYGIYAGAPRVTFQQDSRYNSTNQNYQGNGYSKYRGNGDNREPYRRSESTRGSPYIAEYSQRNMKYDQSNLGKDSQSEATTANKFPGHDISRFSREPDNSEQTRSKQTSSRYDEMPKGKQRDKAKRREQFISSYEEIDDEEKVRAELKRQRKLAKAAKKAAALTPILLPQWISVSNLATALKIKLEDFILKLEDLGFVETNHDHILGAEDAGLIAQEYGFEPIIDRDASKDLEARPPAEDISVLPPRPPIVTIMGHVDHGKTTLLDWLRKSSVAASEHGGITQHIGAFSVSMPSGKMITFLDTPGHAAFLSMRQRGANVTDIVILVVAADDSVKPQTIEAINHAKAAKVPIIIAVNKIDKEESDVDRVKRDLGRHGVEVEDFGGDTQVVCVSGKTGQGMEDLEDAVVTLAEIMDMRAEADGQVEGWVIEASIKSMGKVATVLVKRGTLRPGDVIVAGTTWARVRCLRNEAGVEIEEAGPGTPVEIDGWREQPIAGDEVLQALDESTAKDAVDYRLQKEEREKLAADMEAVNENRKTDLERREREKRETAREAAIKAGEILEDEPEAEVDDSVPGVKNVYFIIKGDVSGSVEAVIDSVSALGTNEVRPVILRSAVGKLSEFDVEHAAAAKGYLINFNTDIDSNIAGRAERAGVRILDHNIIYRLVDDVKSKLSDYLSPILTPSVTGEAEVAQIFDINIRGRKQKPIAGCKVRNGVINKASKVKVVRQGAIIFDGTFASLKNVKKDVMEMRKGTECGIGFEGWNDFEIGDLIQCYEILEQKRFL